LLNVMTAKNPKQVKPTQSLMREERVPLSAMFHAPSKWRSREALGRGETSRVRQKLESGVEQTKFWTIAEFQSRPSAGERIPR
jgi:hypothetical protein